VLLTEKKKEPPEMLDTALSEELDGEGVAELVIDLRKMLKEYDIIRIILPDSPGERLTTENGSELVFFQEETVS
jgi:hypothetical protein